VSYEQTSSAYRFNITLPANRETSLTVSERRPVSERITLLSLRAESFLSYAANQEIPSNVRAALQRAVELRQAVDAADAAARNIETQRTRLISDQDRIRRNLEAAGSQTPQGQDYLSRLAALDREIDEMSAALDRAQESVKTAQMSYESYISSINLQ
jgi:chromosome segregation ATPase